MSSTGWERSPGAVGEFRGCSYCRHLNELDESRPMCPAFPNGIPFPIIAGQADHYVERPGQVPGILFDDTGETYPEMVARVLAGHPPPLAS